MERFANGLSSGQTVECHEGGKKRKARVGRRGELCEVTRGNENGNGVIFKGGIAVACSQDIARRLARITERCQN